jgi:hypothetical protein
MPSVCPSDLRTDLGAALAELGSVPVAITNGGSYNCRGRNNDASANISEHGRGNAFDLGPVKLADGAVIDLSNRFTPQSFRQRLRDATCNRFSTVLGPGLDPYPRQSYSPRPRRASTRL